MASRDRGAQALASTVLKQQLAAPPCMRVLLLSLAAGAIAPSFASSATGVAPPSEPWWTGGAGRHVSFWYWPGAYGGTEMNASLASLSQHPGVVRSVLLFCGHGVSNESAGISVDPRGSPRNSSAICRDGQYGAQTGLIARLKQMGIVPELVLSNGFFCSNHSDPRGGTCTEEADIADYRRFIANATANIAELVRIGQTWGTGGWHFDLEPVRSGSTPADAAMYVQFLHQAHETFAAVGMRTSVATARWTPFLSDYGALAQAVDVVMSMETYEAGSFDGWMGRGQYGGDYSALLAAGAGKVSPGFACPSGSGAPQANLSGPASWNGTMCGAAPCWSDSPGSWAQRLQQMRKDGVREASVFMLNHREGTWACPGEEAFWQALEDFVN